MGASMVNTSEVQGSGFKDYILTRTSYDDRLKPLQLYTIIKNTSDK
jgi:hypothetical protein